MIKVKVEKYVSGFLDTNSYLLEEDGHLLFIDPSDHAAVLEKCRNAATITVLLRYEGRRWGKLGAGVNSSFSFLLFRECVVE